MTPFIKWPGGKSRELEQIRERLPQEPPSRFLEPFLGGGSVLLSVEAKLPGLANDICPELMNLFVGGANQDQALREELDTLARAWEGLDIIEPELRETGKVTLSGTSNDLKRVELLEKISLAALVGSNLDPSQFSNRLRRDIPKKLDRIRKLQVSHNRELPMDELAQNLEASVRSSFYMVIRDRYNQARCSKTFNSQRDADFFFLREFCYASMFRFNSRGEFNVPYGGISYNRKPFRQKINYLFSDRLRPRLENTKFTVGDFSTFFSQADPSESDFIFVDPPYDTTFSHYDGKTFEANDQRRLASLLAELPAKIMIVIGDTPFIRDLYPTSRWNVGQSDLKYQWTIKERNDRDASHLTLTNY